MINLYLSLINQVLLEENHKFDLVYNIFYKIYIITPKLINKASSLDEFTFLLSLYPNIIECFKILSYESVLKKLSIIYKKEKKSIKLISIQKPNENDDIESLSDSFMKVYENFKKEENPLIIDEDFHWIL